RHEPGVALVGEAELIEQPLAVGRRLSIQRRPEIDRLPDLDPLLQLRLLQLDADALLQFVDVAERIETEHRDGAAIRHPQPFDALERGRLAGAVRSDQAEDLAVVHLERHLVHGDGGAVGLAASRDADDYFLVTVHVPPATSLSCPLGRSDQVPFALVLSNVAAMMTSAPASSGKSYFAFIFAPSNDTVLRSAVYGPASVVTATLPASAPSFFSSVSSNSPEPAPSQVPPHVPAYCSPADDCPAPPAAERNPQKIRTDSARRRFTAS